MSILLIGLRTNPRGLSESHRLTVARDIEKSLLRAYRMDPTEYVVYNSYFLFLTSDELLAQRAAERDLYRVRYRIKQPLQKRMMSNIDGALEKVDAASWRRRFESRLPRSPWN